MVKVEILPKYYHPYGALGMCGLYGANGKFNVTNGSSGPNRLYRTSGQREWATNWRFSYEQSKKCVRHAMEVNKLTAGGDMQETEINARAAEESF